MNGMNVFYLPSAGTSPNALVTLRSLTAHLETGAFHGWNQLEMDFRTWQTDIEQLVAGWAPMEEKQTGMHLRISLRAGKSKGQREGKGRPPYPFFPH
jgi:hypothetical protein